ncbi:hypothetical protein CVT91_06510 [Candidatus Atribacteria bacterium HGW-Atribacteria-1]|nr:MAG: hypothetical protein CVT91_06510 [Candidatus Atribacteria bacterium HGW-Atribacteria-1]
MINLKTLFNRRINPTYSLIFITLLIFTVSYNYVGQPINIGLDPSWQFAINYFFENDIQYGRDVLFPYGPFGFLLYPKPIGNIILITAIVTGIFKIIFIYFSLYFNRFFKNESNLFTNSFVILLTAFIAFHIRLDSLLFFLILELLLFHNTNKKSYFLIFSSFLVALLLLIKVSFGVIASLLLAAYLVLNYLSIRKIRNILLSSLVFTTTFLLIWFFLYGNLIGILDYFIALFEFSNGNSSAMTINHSNNWWAFLIYLISFISIPFVIKDKYVLLLFIIMVIPVFLYFKYAMSRLDHIGFFLIFLFQYLYIIILISKKINKESLLLLSVVFLSFSLFVSLTPYSNSVRNFISPTFIKSKFSSQFLTPNEHFEFLKNESNRLIKSQKLNPNVLSIIKSSSIDMYPWEISYVAANKLNWTPRPVFQSYISYTPYLDLKNADFFESKYAPEFLLWDKISEVKSIDNRYLLNDEPLTIYQILNHYEIVFENNQFFIFKRTLSDNLDIPKIINSKNYTWGKWIWIPIENKLNSNNILRAKINIERTIFQKIKKTFYKEFDVHIIYKFEDGSEKKYRLVVDNSKNGVWINPFHRKIHHPTIENKVVAVKLLKTKGDYFKKTFFIDWEIIKRK